MARAIRGKESQAVTVELECLACRNRKSMKLSSEKFAALSSSWKLSQKCDACRKTTDWSFAPAAVEAGEQEDFWDWLAMTGEHFEPAASAPENERRKEHRVDARVLLRIVSPDGQEEEVLSEDISRSGLCFSSPRNYQSGDRIQVVIPLAGSLSPQTRTARIVRVSPSSEGKALYGARLEA